MRQMLLAISAIVGITVAARAQVSLHKQELEDHSFSSSDIRVETMDRTFVPMKLETKTVKVNETVSRTEAVTQTRLADGRYFTSARTTTLTEQVAPDKTRSTTQVMDIGRQGQSQVSREISETVVKSVDGERREVVEALRGGNGELIPSRQTSEVSKKNPDGTVQTIREVRQRTVNNEMALQQKVEETTVPNGANASTTQTTTYSLNHVNGQVVETAREATVRRTQDTTTEIERVISQPRGTVWDVAAKVVTKEQTNPNGSVDREVIKFERPMHSAFSSTSTEPLRPKLKIVDRSVKQPDGRVIVTRDVFFRNVNNEWQPHSFSTAAGNDSDANYGR